MSLGSIIGANGQTGRFSCVATGSFDPLIGSSRLHRQFGNFRRTMATMPGQSICPCLREDYDQHQKKLYGLVNNGRPSGVRLAYCQQSTGRVVQSDLNETDARKTGTIAFDRQ